MLIGYMRPLHEDDECKEQLRKLQENDCLHIFAEAHASAKKRIELDSMISKLKQGDKIIVTKLYVLADSTRHLAELLNSFETRGAFLKSIQEGIDTSHPRGYSFQYMVDHLLEFQSDVISESTKRGLSEAKQKGVTAGRPRKPDANVQRAITMYESKKYSLAEIKSETGISKSTLYRYLEK
ncbi:DNA invertase Pin-like site-specific DNA recombinase [Virgibacillus halotolerans]|uniref:recombinase family protein n=1 Tax=Virgibacillus halotolerans TaxID=1071053 RepID=UPI00195F8656|nr:recombinase family protein [Virgibacillus halotolerans]MBM7598832.1 DNA invertase Pin-like site-specific DNA recombinase [Virgibacillus halotolerans]